MLTHYRGKMGNHILLVKVTMQTIAVKYCHEEVFIQQHIISQWIRYNLMDQKYHIVMYNREKLVHNNREQEH